MNRIVFVFILTIFFNETFGQDTLPRFTLVERNNRVTVSWVNPFETVIQLNVQRSYDSLMNFKTVFSPISPELPQNGFTEAKMPTNQIYYRIFYVLKGGAYFFTKSQRSGTIPVNRTTASTTLKGNALGQVTVNVNTTFYSNIAAAAFPKFRDSILYRTRDTLNTINDSLVVISRYHGPENFRPSVYVYSVKEGITISLPTTNKKYSVKFFEENGKPLFEIPNIREPQLTLDKTNFLHAGWFMFELYEDETLKEKNKFFLSKDF